MLNGIKSDKSARTVAREIHKMRADARAAKYAARIIALESSDYLDAAFSALDSEYMMSAAHAPDSDE